MNASEFVRGLIRLTGMGRAQWRVPRSRKREPQTRLYLALGPYTFILAPYEPRPVLLEKGAPGRAPMVVDAPEVEALATFVRQRAEKHLATHETLRGDDRVPTEWAELMVHARRVKTRDEEERDEREVWRRLGRD